MEGALGMSYSPGPAPRVREGWGLILRHFEQPISDAGSTVGEVSVGQWKPGMSFGEFADATLHEYYAGGFEKKNGSQ